MSKAGVDAAVVEAEAEAEAGHNNGGGGGHDLEQSPHHQQQTNCQSILITSTIMIYHE